MNKFYVFFSMFLLFGCHNNQNGQKETQEEKRYSFQLKEYQDSIPYGRFEKFDSSLWSKYEYAFFPKLYPPIMNKTSLDVYQDSTMYMNSIHEGTYSFFSLQTTEGHVGLVIAGMNDEWENQFLYMSYNKEGKFIHAFPLAFKGGDGGYTGIATGEYLNDSVYYRHSEEYEYDFIKEENNLIKTEKIKVVIKNNGEIDTLSIE